MLALVVAAVSGCEDSAASRLNSRAPGLLKQAGTALSKVSSVKETGANVMSSQDSSIPYQKVTFTSEMDLSDPSKPSSHTVLSRSGNYLDVYSSGGFLFTQDQEGQWHKTASPGTSSMTPGDLIRMTEGAGNLRLSPTAAGYRISFDVDPRTLEKLDILAGDEASAADAAGTAGLRTSALYTIARDTMLVESAKIVMRMPDVTGEGETTGTVTVKLYDFNQPVNTVLPEAAGSAREQ